MSLNRNYTTSTYGVYQYPEPFRKQIMALALSAGWLSKYVGVFRSEFFPTIHEREIANVIIDHRERYPGTLPTYADMLQAISHVPDDDYSLYREYVDDTYRLLREATLQRTEDEVVNWARTNAVTLAILESADDIRSGKLDMIISRTQQALNVGTDLQDFGMSLHENVWVHTLLQGEALGTPWREVNGLLEGGLYSGENGYILAGTGSYKTTTLINIGVWAASVVYRKRVLHFTLEMSEEKTLKRYAYRVSNENFTQESNPEEYAANLQEHLRLKLPGEIRVKHYPKKQATVNDLYDFTRRLQDNGYLPDLIIVDYPDLLRTANSYKDQRFALQEISANISGMAQRLKLPLWAGKQTNRGAFNAKIVDLDDSAEDIGIARDADVVMSVCQTRDEVRINKARFYMAKIREGARKGHQIDLVIKYPAIISTGFTDMSREETTSNE